MDLTINQSRLELVKGNIVEQTTDAIVNAANSALAGGGGVDGAIHRAGGPQIMDECRKYKSCHTGAAVITSGGNLPARFVIHAVGPIYSGDPEDALILASAYKSALKLATQNGVKSVAFPSISTGAYNYPIISAAKVALHTVIDFLNNNSEIELVRFVLFDTSSYLAYKDVLNDITNNLNK